MCKKDISKKSSSVDKVHSPRRSHSTDSDDTSSVHQLLSSHSSDFSLTSDSTDDTPVNIEPQVAVEDLEETVMFEEPTHPENKQVAINVEAAASP